MNSWRNALSQLTEPAILVTVAIAEGSVPRRPGASMLVTATELFDTIGGGHLELRAEEIARLMLRHDDGSIAAQTRLERFPLGPGLGQCCGGIVHLAFERIDPTIAAAMIDGLTSRWRNRQDTWRVVPLDCAAPSALVDEAGRCIGSSTTMLPFQCVPDKTSRVIRDNAGKRWLVDACLAHRPHLMLFGAGHVGAAIIRALADLPCHVTWVDERDDLFPASVPANVGIESTDTPEVLADQAAAGTTFLVMTHSHTIDQKISEHILKRAGNEWFGLIGSKTKRVQFERRLQERGIAADRLAAMVCPIGVPGIGGKEPAVIAASVCAQLLQVWEAAGQANLPASVADEASASERRYR